MKEMVHELDFHREAVKIHGESELFFLGTYIVTTPNPEKPWEALMFYLGFSGNSTTIISSSSPNPPNSTRWRISERSAADSKLRVSTWWCQQKLKARS
jgi:hypothetical protein